MKHTSSLPHEQGMGWNIPPHCPKNKGWDLTYLTSRGTQNRIKTYLFTAPGARDGVEHPVYGMRTYSAPCSSTRHVHCRRKPSSLNNIEVSIERIKSSTTTKQLNKHGPYS
jgi:hypothetical protein